MPLALALALAQLRMLLSAAHDVHDAAAVTEHSVRVGHLVVARTSPDFLSYNIDAFELVAPRPVLQTKLRLGFRGARSDLTPSANA